MRHIGQERSINIYSRLTMWNKWMRNSGIVVGCAAAMWAAAAAGRVMIPGTPVPITLQTLVVMLIGVLLPWRQAASAILLYIAMGACGLPVFAGGGSVMSLVGPSAGFIFGFVPAVIVTSVLARLPRVIGERQWRARGNEHESGIARAGNQQATSEVTPTGMSGLVGMWKRYWGVRVVWFALAAMIGCVVVQYACGITVQCAITHMPLSVVLPASLGFVPGDCMKAAVVAVVAASTMRR